MALLLAIAALLVLSAIPVVAAPNSLALRATYSVKAEIHWGRGSMTVASTAHVTNTTDHSVTELVFNLVPLITGDAKVQRVSVNGHDLDAIAVGQSLLIDLPKPVQPGHRADVTIHYSAAFNAVSDQHQKLFMQQDQVMTAYRWIPWLSRRQPFGAPNSGETWVSAVSPRVSVTLVSRSPLVFATSGHRTRNAKFSQTFVATNVRDFNFSASPDYKVKATRWHGITVRVFYLGLPPQSVSSAALDALKTFSAEVGPYPYRQLNIAETPIPTGMESPGLSWISSAVEPSRLQRLVTHEVAHQWFYATVGSNQAQQPFLDEALADFLTGSLLDVFRGPRCPIAPLDGTVYDYSAKCYPEVIYVQGSRYLQHYEQLVGGDAFWAGLRQFYSDYTFRIAGTRALLDALDAASGYDSELHAKRFPSLYP